MISTGEESRLEGVPTAGGPPRVDHTALEERSYRMKDIGVAVAGAGFIGPVHVEALKRVGVTVTGIEPFDI